MWNICETALQNTLYFPRIIMDGRHLRKALVQPFTQRRSSMRSEWISEGFNHSGLENLQDTTSVCSMSLEIA